MALVSPQMAHQLPSDSSLPPTIPTPPPAPTTPPQTSLQGGEEKESSQIQESQLLSVGFNQDYGCFACGTDTGFRIYNCDPFKETFRREFTNGGIGLVEMLFRCNILAVVGGGQTPRYPANKVMIWDDHQSRCIGELSFRSEVRAVRLRRDRICVVLEHKIYLYNFADLKLLHQIETMANPKGLCGLSPASNSTVLACPGLRRGQVRVELYDTKRTRFIEAHDSALACFALTLDGTRLATASVKGTLVRIFSTTDGAKLQELRRGADRADIYSIAFSPQGQWLGLSSDKGTVHVFALKGSPPLEERGTDTIAGNLVPPSPTANTIATNGSGSPGRGGVSCGSPNGGGNPGSSFAFMKGVLPKYFSSEWSFAQFRLPEETRSIVAFGPQKNTLIVVGTDGSYHKCLFDGTVGGEMVRQDYVRFMASDREAEEGT